MKDLKWKVSYVSTIDNLIKRGKNVNWRKSVKAKRQD